MPSTPGSPDKKALRIRLRHEAFRAVADERRWTNRDGSINAAAVADDIDMHRVVVWRQIRPGPHTITASFVSHLVAGTGRSFEELFEIVDDADAELAAS